VLKSATPKRTRRRQTAARPIASSQAPDGARAAEIAKGATQPITDLKTSTEEQQLKQWLRRPYVHSADGARKVKKIAKGVGWSDERLIMFTKLIAEYRDEPSIENYLRIRREFPEVEIRVDQFLESVFISALADAVGRQGIEPELIAAAWYGGAPYVDALCLRLLELRSARDKLPKDGPGHIQRRRGAINDSTINYLIATMLETLASGEGKYSIPASLVVLIRHQFCGANPDLHTASLLESKRNALARVVAEKLKADEKLSINKLVQMTGLPRATAARMLKDGFSGQVELVQRAIAAKYRSHRQINNLMYFYFRRGV
jgi:hypothetical protein